MEKLVNFYFATKLQQNIFAVSYDTDKKNKLGCTWNFRFGSMCYTLRFVAFDTNFTTTVWNKYH